MEQAIQIFSNPEFGDVRIIGDAENPRGRKPSDETSRRWGG